eukprot:scaffold22056_cov113-Isochrysis_galbana.AAC.6
MAGHAPSCDLLLIVGAAVLSGRHAPHAHTASSTHVGTRSKKTLKASPSSPRSVAMLGSSHSRITASRLGCRRFFSMLWCGFIVLALLPVPFSLAPLPLRPRILETACIRRIKSSSAGSGSALSSASRLDMRSDGSSVTSAALIAGGFQVPLRPTPWPRSRRAGSVLYLSLYYGIAPSANTYPVHCEEADRDLDGRAINRTQVRVAALSNSLHPATKAGSCRTP